MDVSKNKVKDIDLMQTKMPMFVKFNGERYKYSHYIPMTRPIFEVWDVMTSGLREGYEDVWTNVKIDNYPIGYAIFYRKIGGGY
jgi:hypothetical protein